MKHKKVFTPEVQKTITDYQAARKTWVEAKALMTILREDRAKFLATDPTYTQAEAAKMAVAGRTHTSAEIRPLIEATVNIESDWEEAAEFWQTNDLLRQAEESLFDAALACMAAKGYAEKMAAGGISKEMFNKAKLNHLFTFYPKLIDIAASFDPTL